MNFNFHFKFDVVFTQSIYIRPCKCYWNSVTLNIFSQNLFLNINNTKENVQVLSNYEWNSFEYTFILHDSLRNRSGNNWFTFVLNFIFACLIQMLFLRFCWWKLYNFCDSNAYVLKSLLVGYGNICTSSGAQLILRSWRRAILLRTRTRTYISISNK